MSDDLTHVDFGAKSDGERWPTNIGELIDGWIEFQELFDVDKEEANKKFFWAYRAAIDLCQLEPDTAIEFILKLLSKDLSPDTEIMVACGPLEDLMMSNSEKAIDRLESEAKQNPKLRQALRRIYRYGTSDEVWDRILKAAKD